MSLIQCYCRGDTDGIRRLFANGADPDERSPRDGRTILMLATAHLPDALHPDTDEIFNLALKAGADVNLQDRMGWTALHFAAQEYSVGRAAELLRRGAAVDMQDAHGNTPLWYALMRSRGRGEMIRLLLDAGADRNHLNKYKKSPLDVARMVGNFDLMQFFGD